MISAPGLLPSNKMFAAGWALPHVCLTVWVGGWSNLETRFCLGENLVWSACLYLSLQAISSCFADAPSQQQAPRSYATLFQDKAILTLAKCSLEVYYIES